MTQDPGPCRQVILSRDETERQRHERYARMLQSILRRRAHGRDFEARLVQALQSVKRANALAALFVGGAVWCAPAILQRLSPCAMSAVGVITIAAPIDWGR